MLVPCACFVRMAPTRQSLLLSVVRTPYYDPWIYNSSRKSLHIKCANKRNRSDARYPDFSHELWNVSFYFIKTINFHWIRFQTWLIPFSTQKYVCATDETTSNYIFAKRFISVDSKYCAQRQSSILACRNDRHRRCCTATDLCKLIGFELSPDSRAFHLFIKCSKMHPIQMCVYFLYKALSTKWHPLYLYTYINITRAPPTLCANASLPRFVAHISLIILLYDQSVHFIRTIYGKYCCH